MCWFSGHAAYCASLQQCRLLRARAMHKLLYHYCIISWYRVIATATVVQHVGGIAVYSNDCIGGGSAVRPCYMRDDCLGRRTIIGNYAQSIHEKELWRVLNIVSLSYYYYIVVFVHAVFVFLLTHLPRANPMTYNWHSSLRLMYIETQFLRTYFKYDLTTLESITYSILD